jgi:hypothetical protein
MSANAVIVKQLLNFLYLCKTLYLPMDEILTHERKRRWFLWGTVVSCTLFIPLIIGMSNAFRGISTEKQTGLTAVAGGLAEGYVIYGVILAFAMPITAIFLLSRSFARGHGVRSLFSLVCICWNALMLALAGLFLWLYLVYIPRAGAHPR